MASTKNRILLIDDEESFCFFVKKNLERNGEFSVIYTTNPDKGIKIAQKNRPDLILLDILMPRKDGFKVLEILKKNFKTLSIPVIMLTALGDEETKLKASALYNENYITKPVTYEILRLEIEKALIRHRG
jgi:DNA-binding response OmpR family regulator